MTIQGVLAVIIFAAAAIFAVLNQPLLYTTQTITIPGGTYTLPLAGVLIAALAGTVLLLLLADAVSVGVWRSANSRLRHRLAERDRELAAMRTGEIDDLPARLDAMRMDLSEQIAALRRLIETRPVQTTVVREERAGLTPPR